MSAIQQSAVTQVTSPGNSNYDPYYSNISLLLSMNGSNGSTSFIDASPNQKTVTVNGNTQLSTVQSKFGSTSAYFNGVDSYLDVSASEDFNFGTGDFTVEFWFYSSSVPTASPYRRIIAHPNSTNAANTFQIWQAGDATTGSPTDSVSLAMPDGTGVLLSTIDPVTPLGWCHIAFTRSSGTLRAFLNGVLKQTVNNNTTNFTRGAIEGFRIGSRGDLSAPTFLHGYLDDLRITKGLARYTSNFAVPVYANPLTGSNYDPFYNNVSLLLHCNGTNASTNFIDNSGSPKTVTANGSAQISTVQWRFGGSSAFFNGSGNSLDVSASTDLALTGDFTVEWWQFLTAWPSIEAYPFGWSGGQYISITPNGRLSVISTVNINTPISTLVLNSWQFIAVARSGTTTKIFVNGIEQASGTGLGNLGSGTAPLYIGAIGTSANGANTFGYTDDVRITKGVARYTTNFTPPRLAYADSGPSIDAYYDQTGLLLPMNGGNGSTSFIDSSKTAKAITVNGDAQISTAQSKFGGSSAYFDGNGDYLSIPDSPEFNFGTGDFTIELWLYIPSSASVDKGIIGKGTWPASPNDPFLFYYGGAGELSFYYSTGSGWAGSGNFISSTSRNIWMHLAVARSGNNIRLFYNGSLASTITTTSALATNSNPVTIGSGNAGSNSINGYIDDLRITKGIARYTGNFTVPVRPNPTTGIPYDNYYDNVSLLLRMNGPNNGTSFVDSSLITKTITRNGNSVTSTTQYKYGISSGYFDGSNAWLSTPDSTDLELSGVSTFTIEAWIYPTVITAGRQTILGKWTSPAYAFLFQLFGAKLAFAVNNSYYANTTGDVISVNVWTHVALVRSGNNWSMYANGSQVFTDTNNIVITNDNVSWNIGRNPDLGGAQYYNGYIDDLRITKGIARYTGNFTPPTQSFPDVGPQTDPFYYNTSLLLHFDNVNSSTNFVDNSPVIKSITPFGNAQISTAQSKFGGSSAYFDGNGDYLTIPSSTDLDISTGNFTIEAWVYLNAMPTTDNLITWQNWMIIYERGSASASNGWQFQIGQTLLMFSDSYGTAVCSGTHGMVINTWYHLSVSRSGTTFRVFVNGVQVGTSTSSITLNSGPTYWIGTETGEGAYLNGYIDDLRVTKGVARYINNFSPPQRPSPNQ